MKTEGKSFTKSECHLTVMYRWQNVLADDWMRGVAAKFVPCLLNNSQEDHWIQVWEKLQENVIAASNFLSKVINDGWINSITK